MDFEFSQEMAQLQATVRRIAKDKVKSYSTCEAVVLDVRTGLVPFTRIVTREKLAKKEAEEGKNKTSEGHPEPKKGWLQKVAGKVGFMKNVSLRRNIPQNKGS